jgi:hypothetical protein
MKRFFHFLVILSILMFACNITSLPVQPTVTLPPVPTIIPGPTDTLIPTDSSIPTEPPEPVGNVSCNELSLHLDPALASGYTCETVPENTQGMEITPQYTNVTFQGYILSGKFFDAHISIFPIQRYSELLPENVPQQVIQLQALIGGGSAGDSLPLLPAFNAAQVFHSQYHVLPFGNGGGIRYITLYAQYYAPINNHDLFYTYQGLTTDGLYWVSAVLPINNPILPENGNNPPNGMTQEQFSATYATYLADITSQLNSQAADSFTPSLAALDALAGSITIQP